MFPSPGKLVRNSGVLERLLSHRASSFFLFLRWQVDQRKYGFWRRGDTYGLKIIKVQLNDGGDYLCSDNLIVKLAVISEPVCAPEVWLMRQVFFPLHCVFFHLPSFSLLSALPAPARFLTAIICTLLYPLSFYRTHYVVISFSFS